MVDAIVSNVIDKLTTIVWDEIKQEVQLVVGVEEDVEKLKFAFINIQDVLDDAEKKQFMKPSVKLWLQKLKDVAYEIEDVLDEWNTAILKSQLEQRRSRVDDDARRTNSSSTSKKVCLGNLFSLPSCCFPVKQVGLRHHTGSRIKRINEKMVEIANLREQFDFIRKTTTRSSNGQIRDKESKSILETSSSVDVSEVFGRDDDRARIISKLLGHGGSSQQQLVVPASTIPIISIVGMGGLGKTTLAQLVFNEERVVKHFEKRVWVHVGSQSFDKKKVAIDIIKEIGGIGDFINQLDGDYNNNTWQSVHDQLNKSVNGKHFLLVLDDVWNENSREWDPLRVSLKHGSPGITIIVTTRKLEVANMMGATYVHNLDMLSEEACWSLLRSYAFVGRQEEECKKLEETGRKLVEKCKGLPLSIRTLGGVLRSKISRQDWQSVLDDDLWNVISTNDQILPSLLISYNELDPHLKQCFAYCSYIPRGYTLIKQDMIFKWMGQGYLSDCTSDSFTVGEEYFNHLVKRSFFQKKVTESSGSSKYYNMHDLIYDFAKSLEENACISLEIRDTTRTEKLSSRARHLSLVLEGINEIPSFIYEAKYLRTFEVYGSIPKISSELFCHLTCLRTLDLSKADLEELPNEIDKLIHLRFLDLSSARFEELPKSVTGLHNLQTLWLGGCSNLRKLPEGIGRMTNLVDIDLAECRQLSYLPEGIGRLIKLRGLTDFIIGGGGGGVETRGCKIAELKDLNFLHDTLSIIGLGRVENGSDAETACLKNKQHLRALYFYFDQFTGVSRVDDERNGNEEGEEAEEEGEGEGEGGEGEGGEGEGEEEEGEGEEEEEEEGNNEGGEGEDMLWRRRMEDVLEGLKPHPNIEKLSITDYPGVVIPNWLCSPTRCINLLSNLVFLELSDWKKYKQLPSTLGKLPSLETLVIDGMNEVKFMGLEFFGINDDDGGVDTILFPKLKVFMLADMQNLEEWDVRVQQTVEDGKHNAASVGFIFMPCLQYLFLFDLPKLRSIPQHLTQSTSLKKLLIWSCPNLTWTLPTPSLSHLPPSFPHVEELILKRDAGSLSKSLLLFPKLKLLRVRVSPYSSLSQGLGQLTSLEILDIRTCSKIKSTIPQGEEDGVLQRLPALRELRIVRCPALRQSCQKEIGEDWSKISHIPNIFIDDQKIK